MQFKPNGCSSILNGHPFFMQQRLNSSNTSGIFLVFAIFPALAIILLSNVRRQSANMHTNRTPLILGSAI